MHISQTLRAGAVAAFALLTFLTSAYARDKRVVTDMAGRQVQITTPVETIATQGSVPVINSFVFAVGAGNKIINGLPDFARSPRWRYQAVFAPAMADKPTMQGPDRAPDVEKLAQAQPDVIFTMDRPVADQLTALGMPAVFLSWREPQDVKAAFRLVAAVLGDPRVSERYDAYFDRVVGQVEGRVLAARAERPKVLYLAAGAMQQPHLIVEWWIKAAGGVSVTDDGRKTEARNLTIEQVLGWNPDVVVVSSPKDLEVIAKDARFATLKAVVDKRVHVAPIGAHTWANRTIENPLTVLWAAKLLHPKLLEDLRIVEEVRSFYADFFKVELKKEQVEEILSGKL